MPTSFAAPRTAYLHSRRLVVQNCKVPGLKRANQRKRGDRPRAAHRHWHATQGSQAVPAHLTTYHIPVTLDTLTPRRGTSGTSAAVSPLLWRNKCRLLWAPLPSALVLVHHQVPGLLPTTLAHEQPPTSPCPIPLDARGRSKQTRTGLGDDDGGHDL